MSPGRDLDKLIADLARRVSTLETQSADHENRLDSLGPKVESLMADQDGHEERILELEAKVAGLTPCPPPPTDTPAPDTPLLAVSPMSLALAAIEGDPAPAVQNVTASNIGTGTLDTPTVSVISDPDDIINTVVITGTGPWNIAITPKNAAAGTHNASVTINSTNNTGGPQTISVSLVVSAAAAFPTLIATPASLDFSAVVGGFTPPAQNVTLTKGGTGTLDAPTAIIQSDPDSIIASAIVSQISSQSWRLAVTVNLVAAGSYTATIRVASPNQTNSPIDISVDLVMSATALTTYRGANLPQGKTSTFEQSQGLLSTLSTPFGGDVWQDSDLIIGSSRYNAATTLTVTSTGAAGRAQLIAHLATVAANDQDYKIILPYGVLAGGNYIGPAKVNPNRHCWIVINAIHGNTGFISRGTKVLPSTTGMTTLQGADATVHDGIFEFADSGMARGYSFHGCIIQNDQTSPLADIQLGVITCRRTTPQTVLNDYPGHLYLDRCWVRGSPTTDVRRGILMNGPNLHVEDSRITEIHKVGDESAGVGGWTGAKFHKRINLTIEAGTQIVLYGGADPDQPGTNTLDPSDHYDERVYGRKPLTWLTTHPSYAGIHWTVKTGFEAKNCRRWLIDRCFTDGCWPDSQVGYAFLLQNLSDQNTNDTENRVEDIIVRNHRFNYVVHGMNLLSRVAYGGGTLPAHRMTRIVLDNILETRVGGNRGDDPAIILNGATQNFGTAIQLLGDIDDLIVDRISSDGLDTWLRLEGSGGTDWAISNIVAQLKSYGIFRSGGLTGEAALIASCGSGASMAGCVGYDLTERDPSTMGTGWDADETNASMLFQDYANYDYRPTTAHLTKGVGGGRPGCDIATLNALLGGVNT